jgi:methylaspartate mutase epsilon subunit
MTSQPVNPGYFHHFVERKRAEGELIVQPRMGFSDFRKMRQGLTAVRDCPAPTIGTITLDSYTRQGQFEKSDQALKDGSDLNGYPIVSHGAERNRELIDGLLSAEFPIQVRHGTPLPEHVFQAVIEAGLEVTEGGPISYCLPYGRSSLRACLQAWGEGTRHLAALAERGTLPHLESFGGCMLGQLCPPALLVAVSILEGLFSIENGIRSLSLSYAQGYNSAQDVGAILALRQLAAELLSASTWHVVVYSFMGLFPMTHEGARQLIEESARVAALSGSERLIVKTVAEAFRIPTIEENVDALTWAYEASKNVGEPEPESQVEWHREMVYAQAKFLVDLVLDLDPSLPRAIESAFQKGYLDVPYCLHTDNRNRTRSWLDSTGNIFWAATGDIPFPGYLKDSIFKNRVTVTSGDLARMLRFNIAKYDGSISQAC